MELSTHESSVILAKAVIEKAYVISSSNPAVCMYCDSIKHPLRQIYYPAHKDDCPVLLAEKILKYGVHNENV
jgi:hypothetical protein